MIEIKLDRLIDDMRLLRSQMIALHTRRSLSQTKRAERTTVRERIEPMVRGRCSRDGKDSFRFVCSRGSNRRTLALFGSMTRQRDCDLRVN